MRRRENSLMQPLLSVIIPVYNVEKYLKRCLDSVTKQTYSNLEIILVDDGSPDNSGSICDEYAKTDQRVKVIHQENTGVSKARNNGIDAATGECITFVDPDDWLDIEMYMIMMEYLLENNLDIVCIDTYQVKYNKTVFKPLFCMDKVFDGQKALVAILTDSIDTAVWNKIYKRSVVEGIYFPVGRRYEDVATVYKYFANAKLVGYISKPMYYYFLKNPNSFISSSFNVSSRFDCFLAYRERYNFALNNCDERTIICCHKLVIKQALSTLTAMYVADVRQYLSKYNDIELTLKNGKQFFKENKIGIKNSILMWSFFHCKTIHVVYGNLSCLHKRIRNKINKL